ncbi:hypothetical protein [Pontixanthobacter sp. CEM42]|uniref:hypothetical protein n=1 Tax=Pontixanthobacter sp. CEM42 TaxID=2792077 RepID=UPI001ADF28C4|nr:hypothetical protein [Pontixanthobacter sp. CEM42]
MKGWLQRSLARLRCTEPFIFLAIVGVAYLAAAGAPTHYVWINGTSLIAAIVAIVALGPVRSAPVRYVLVAGAVALLALTLLVGPSVADVQRWLQMGPVTVHIGMLVLPALCALLPSLDDRIAAIVMIGVAAILALQPDAGTSIAWMIASFALAVRAYSIWIGIAFVLTLLAWISAAFGALAGAENLPPVAFVEGVFGYLLRNEIWWFFPASGFALWLVFRIGSITADLAAGHMLQSFTYGLFLAAVLRDYPTPILGYGAAPILGYGLALGLMELQQSRSREFDDDDFDTY